MRLPIRTQKSTRRGKVLLLTAILMPALLGLMALSADIAVLTTVHTQLSTAADAASLAGAMQLADEYRVRGQSGLQIESTAARSRAQSVGQSNTVLNGYATINQNESNDTAGDVVIGYVNPANPRGAIQTTASFQPLFNAVQVRASRDTAHGGPVPAFFSKIWGNKGTSATVTACAIAQNYPVAGFRPAGSVPANSPNAPMIPIVLDVTTYTAMMAGLTTDSYTFDPATNTVRSGADGITESVLYPVGSGSSGSWGTINVGVTDNGTGTIAAQIQSGITPSQLATYPNSTIALDYTQTPPSIQFSGNPGISAGLESALESIVGKTVAIPIYDLSGGSGNTAWYRVIAFQPCRILSVNFQGNPKYVVVQPSLMRNPTAVPVTDPNDWPANWSWKSGGVVRLHLVH